MRVAGVARVARCGSRGIAGCCWVSRGFVVLGLPSSVLRPPSSVLGPPSSVFRQSHPRFPRLVPDSRFQILRFFRNALYQLRECGLHLMAHSTLHSPLSTFFLAPYLSPLTPYRKFWPLTPYRKYFWPLTSHPLPLTINIFGPLPLTPYPLPSLFPLPSLYHIPIPFTARDE
jgi:hypothetical protein